MSRKLRKYGIIYKRKYKRQKNILNGTIMRKSFSKIQGAIEEMNGEPVV